MNKMIRRNRNRKVERNGERGQGRNYDTPGHTGRD